jgi:hypothetical protein
MHTRAEPRAFRPVTAESGRDPDCLLEGDGFEPSVPRKFFWLPRRSREFTFRNINRHPSRQGPMGRALPSYASHPVENIWERLRSNYFRAPGFER